MGTNKRIYAAKAKTWGLGTAGEKGTPEVAVEFEIVTPDADIRNITWHGYLTEATLERTVESLRNCGWKGDDVSDGLPGLDTNEVSLVIEDEEYQGKTYAKVQWVNKKGGLALKAPMQQEQAKAFGASLRDKIRAIEAAKKAGQPKSSSAPSSPPPAGEKPLSDADVPF